MGTFESQLVKKHQTDVSAIEDKAIFLYPIPTFSGRWLGGPSRSGRAEPAPCPHQRDAVATVEPTDAHTLDIPGGDPCLPDRAFDRAGARPIGAWVSTSYSCRLEAIRFPSISMTMLLVPEVPMSVPIR